MRRDKVQVILSDEGHQVHVAASAEEALRVAKISEPDVVLTDLRMYKIEIKELMEKLRSQGDAPEVIIMSGSGTPLIIEESAGKGAFRFIQRPLDIPKLYLT